MSGHKIGISRSRRYDVIPLSRKSVKNINEIEKKNIEYDSSRD